MSMAKQPPRSDSAESPTNRPAQAAKPRRTRAGGVSGRAEAEAGAAPATGTETFVSRSRTDDSPPPLDASEPATRSESMASSPSEEDIRLRAYQRYLERGGGHGMDFEDWLEAERELKRQK
jgi:hypothetical protein